MIVFIKGAAYPAPQNWKTDDVEKFKTLHGDLQLVCYHANKVLPFRIIEGHRSDADQIKYVLQGKSKLPPGKSKHNRTPSEAVDIYPLPLDWKDAQRFCLLAGVMLATAAAHGVKLRWGGDWNRNGQIKDETFLDLVHFELEIVIDG